MGQPARIDEKCVRFFARFLDEIDECALTIGLLENDCRIARLFTAECLDIGEGCGAVNLGLTCAQQVEIRAIENI